MKKLFSRGNFLRKSFSKKIRSIFKVLQWKSRLPQWKTATNPTERSYNKTEQTVVVVESGESVFEVVQCVRVSLKFQVIRSLTLYPMCCKLVLWGSPIFFNPLYAVRWFLRSISLHFSRQSVRKHPAILSASSVAAILSSLSFEAVNPTKPHRSHPGKNFAAQISKRQPPRGPQKPFEPKRCGALAVYPKSKQ